MLGIAASSSTAPVTMGLSHLGTSSVIKMDMPILTGVAMSTARNVMSRVPYMAGNPPNTSATGSHTVPVINPNPNLFIESQDSFASIKKAEIGNTTPKNIAQKPSEVLNISSTNLPFFLPLLPFVI